MRWFHSRARFVLRSLLAILSAAALALLVRQPPGGAAQGPSAVAQPSGSSVQGAIDLPADGSALDGASYVIGWAVDTGSGTGTGVDRVAVYLDGVAVGDAHLGLPRDDIAAAYGQRFRPSGWQALLDLDTLTTSGSHQLEARAHSALTGSVAVYTRSVSITSPPLFCVNDHPLRFDVKYAAGALDEIRANDLTTVRIDVSWAELEPDSAGSWDPVYLARLDDVLALATARGLRPILVVLATPGWARNGAGTSMSPPAEPTSYANAVGRLAARYANRPGMVFEIWNEPNQHQFWNSPSGQADPATYTGLLRAAYASIKANAPSATVLGGSIAYNDPGYLDSMYAAGAAGAFDGLALHPYSARNAPDATNDPAQSFILALDQAQDMLATHGEAGKPIWITEMGWGLSDVTDQTRGDFLRRAVEIVRSRPNVAAFCAYTLDQMGDDANYGLIGSGGVPTGSWLNYGKAVAQR